MMTPTDLTPTDLSDAVASLDLGLESHTDLLVAGISAAWWACAATTPTGQVIRWNRPSIATAVSFVIVQAGLRFYQTRLTSTGWSALRDEFAELASA